MNRIRYFRLQKNWSQSKLARESGLSQAHIHDIETGNKSPTIRSLKKIAKALNVHVSELLDDNEQGEDMTNEC